LSVSSLLRLKNWWYVEQALAYRISWEMYTPYAGDSGMLLHINGNLYRMSTSIITFKKIKWGFTDHWKLYSIYFFNRFQQGDTHSSPLFEETWTQRYQVELVHHWKVSLLHNSHKDFPCWKFNGNPDVHQLLICIASEKATCKDHTQHRLPISWISYRITREILFHDTRWNHWNLHNPCITESSNIVLHDKWWKDSGSNFGWQSFILCLT
jgi:hypothetical protein